MSGMQDVNLLAPPPGDVEPTMDTLEFKDIAHSTPSRKATVNIPMHDMKADSATAFPLFDPKDVPHANAPDLLHDSLTSNPSVGLIDSGMSGAPGGPPAGGPAASASPTGGSAGATAAKVDPSAGASFYQLAYYRSYFDVTTAQMGSRLLRALVPTRSYFYSASAVDGSGDDDKPDLYGPFWIATTLVFLMAATGNFASYLTIGPGKIWRVDMETLTVAATVFYSFVFPVPLCIYIALRYISLPKPLVLVVSLYGYSLLTYLPACVLCVTPVMWVRWLVVALAAFLSTRFLVRNLMHFGPNLTPETMSGHTPVPSEEPTGAASPTSESSSSSLPVALQSKLLVVMAVVAVLHLGLAVVTKLYFFDFEKEITVTTIAPVATSTGVSGP